MAIVSNGIPASVSWASNTLLVSSGAEVLVSSVDIDGSPQVTTALGAGTQTSTGTLRSGTVTLTSRIDAAEIGNEGGLSWASSAYYGANITQWTLTVATTVTETTVQNTGSAPTWRSFAPGLVVWSGRYDAFPDTSVNQTAPSSAVDTTPERQLVLTLRDSNTFTGNAIVSRHSMNLNPQNSTVTYNFDGAGDLVKAGSTFLPAGTLGTTGSDVGFATGSLVVTYASGQTFTGNAFPESVTITCGLDQVLTVQTRARFTGEVTYA